MTLDRMYHFTSERLWAEIQRHGALVPRSRPFTNHPLVQPPSERIRALVDHDAYVVGVDEPEARAWKQYDLYNDLDQWTSHGATTLILLEVPLLDTAHAFVRESYFICADFFRTTCGKDIRAALKNHLIDLEDYGQYLDGVNRYNESAVSINDYDGSYKIPEIWTPQTTPTRQLRIIPLTTQQRTP